MQVWAVTMVKDEADVIEHTIRHLTSEGVDGIIVADNGSTDGTSGKLLSLADELARTHPDLQYHVIDDDEPGYYQSNKMTNLARSAADAGADWIVPFDADELWSAHSEPLAEQLRRLPDQIQVAEAKLWNYFCTEEDPQARIPFQRMVHRSPEVGALPKVAFRWCDGAAIQPGNHSVDVGSPYLSDRCLRVSHFPYRSFVQLRRKIINGAAAYKATDLPDYYGAHWRQYGQIFDEHGDEGLREIWNTWFHFTRAADAQLKHDPAPFLRWAEHVF